MEKEIITLKTESFKKFLCEANQRLNLGDNKTFVSEDGLYRLSAANGKVEEVYIGGEEIFLYKKKEEIKTGDSDITEEVHLVKRANIERLVDITNFLHYFSHKMTGELQIFRDIINKTVFKKIFGREWQKTEMFEPITFEEAGSDLKKLYAASEMALIDKAIFAENISEGIEVAKMFLADNEFLKQTITIRNSGIKINTAPERNKIEIFFLHEKPKMAKAIKFFEELNVEIEGNFEITFIPNDIRIEKIDGKIKAHKRSYAKTDFLALKKNAETTGKEIRYHILDEWEEFVVKAERLEIVIPESYGEKGFREAKMKYSDAFRYFKESGYKTV